MPIMLERRLAFLKKKKKRERKSVHSYLNRHVRHPRRSRVKTKEIGKNRNNPLVNFRGSDFCRVPPLAPGFPRKNVGLLDLKHENSSAKNKNLFEKDKKEISRHQKVKTMYKFLPNDLFN